MRSRPIRSVAVVGAGMGGLTASLYLAQRGHEVFLLERAKYPGGTAGFYTKRGRVYPTGATLTFGLEPGGLFASILQEVGVHLPLYSVNHVMDVRLPDRNVPVVASRAEWLAALKTSFPERASQVVRFWRAVEKTAQAAYLFAKARAALPVQAREDFLHILATMVANKSMLGFGVQRLRATVADALREFHLDDYGPFRLFIDAQLFDAVQTTSEWAAWLPSCLALDIYRYGVWLPQGGVPALAAAMADRARTLGVHVLFSNTVTDATYSHASNQWCLRTNRRHELCVDAVVNATGTRVTAQTDEPVSGDTSASQASGAQWGAVRVDALMSGQGVQEAWFHRDDLRAPFAIQIADDAGLDAPDERPCGPLYITFHPGEAAEGDSGAPAGDHAIRITVSAHTRPHDWLNLPKAMYHERKQRYLQDMFERIDRRLPHFSEHMVTCSMGTPLTYARYLNKAWVGGVPLTVANAISQPRGPKTSWPRWYLAGDTVFPGPGMLSAALSGFFAARSIDPRIGQRAYKVDESANSLVRR